MDGQSHPLGELGDVHDEMGPGVEDRVGHQLAGDERGVLDQVVQPVAAELVGHESAGVARAEQSWSEFLLRVP